MIDILIFGLILVALMVYASTKIKKVAAKAYAPETVETDDFRITKPEGFLSVISPADGRAFHAYSREFGEAEAAGIRRTEATIRIIENAAASDVAADLKASAPTVIRESSDEDGRSITLEIGDEINDVPVFRLYRMIANGSRVVRLQIDTPVDYRDEFDIAIREFRDTFEVKSASADQL